MKEEIYKTFEKMSLYADVEISNFGDVCAISKSKKPCKIYSNVRGNRFLKIWKINHWETFSIECEICKLFPEEKNNYTKDFCYREEARTEEKSVIKKDYAEGNSISEISKAYKLKEDVVREIIFSQKSDEKTLILVEY